MRGDGFSDKVAYGFVVLGIILLLIVGVSAVAPNPGHSSAQIECDTTLCVTGSGTGIGTNAPSSKLDVVSSTSNYVNNIKFGDSSKGYLAAGANGIFISDNSGTPRLTVRQSGEVGVGTTTPTSKFQVTGGRARFDNGVDVYSSLFLGQFSGQSGCYIEVSGGSLTCTTPSGGGISGSANFLPVFTSGNTLGDSAVYMDPSEWRIGIGTQGFVDSTDRFHVAYSGDTKAIVESTGGNHAALRLKSGADSWITGVESGNKRFRIYQETGGSPGEKLTIAPGGRVGIGTTSPTQQLDVQGNVEVNGLLFWGSDANGWSYLYESGGAIIGSSTNELLVWKGGSPYIGYGGLRVGSITTVKETGTSGFGTGELKLGGPIKASTPGSDIIIQLG